MSLTLQIPDSVLQGMRLPEQEIPGRLLAELAIGLYSQDVLSLGKAAELAGENIFRFGELVADRGIPRHYGDEDLAQDLAYARGK